MVPVLRCATALFTVSVATFTGVSPNLEPASDKKFFGKDYPWDKRPVADHHYVFDHPYPAVQDTGDYDRDFVKDENADGGRWKAQMEYDVLRNKIRKAEKALGDAKKKLDEEEAEWKSAQDKYGQTTSAEATAEQLRKKAEKDAAAAAATVKRLSGSANGGSQVGGEVGDAVKKVNDEMSDLEKCKKELADARKRLKELMDEKDALDKQEKSDAEKKAAAEKAAAAAKAKKDKENKQKEKDQNDQHQKKKQQDKGRRDGERAKADKEVADKSSSENIWKKKLAEETAEHAKSVKTYEQEMEDVKRTEAQLKEAAKNLRKYRRPPYVDSNGGVYYEEDDLFKNTARPVSIVVAMVLAVVALITL